MTVWPGCGKVLWSPDTYLNGASLYEGSVRRQDVTRAGWYGPTDGMFNIVMGEYSVRWPTDRMGVDHAVWVIAQNSGAQMLNGNEWFHVWAPARDMARYADISGAP